MNGLVSALSSPMGEDKLQSESPLTKEFKLLNQNLEFLFSRINSLEKRLSPILQQRKEEAELESKDEAAPQSQICKDIRLFAVKAHNAGMIVQGIERRLTI